MVRPAQFAYNQETAATNIFQQPATAGNRPDIQQKALYEFDQFVQLLRSHKMYVMVLQDQVEPGTPDAVFPNNWISFHENSMALYPMLALNRRMERRTGWIRLLKQVFHKETVTDFTDFELQHQYLEGTGSLVLDRMNRIAYANISSRTHESPLHQFAATMHYDLITFSAALDGKEIYHTNVMMAIGEKTALVCSEVIQDTSSRQRMLKKLGADRELVEITREQVRHYAGNLLLVKNRDGERFWVMSEQACHALTENQKDTLRKDGELCVAALDTIETAGGGSARCMLAEIF